MGSSSRQLERARLNEIRIESIGGGGGEGARFRTDGKERGEKNGKKKKKERANGAKRITG